MMLDLVQLDFMKLTTNGRPLVTQYDLVSLRLNYKTVGV
jgi:hypothetical protein